MSTWLQNVTRLLPLQRAKSINSSNKRQTFALKGADQKTITSKCSNIPETTPEAITATL